ncbi:transposase [Rubellimicrobium rubrum]|uniref:Transposase n=1 Tax=Rubellimicrobium rubrum TaxID=2585369 RepID=A0A5C4MQV2_9RHOB|nr:transposase [Rubellimicrobium rubrum]TNC47724.1 transposase [Rubellimicrobium rubrum]
MMGQQVEQAALFYEFRLEERVPEGHLLRRVDAILDLSFVREHMAPHYSTIGRPSVCPELMVRMLLVGYLYGLRSERRLCEEVDLNLAYRWFCRLGLEGRVPDHSTFTKARHGRFRDSGLLREVFERLVEQCLRAGLASVEHVAVDGSHVLASADPYRRVARRDELPREAASRAVREYWEGLDETAPDLEGVERTAPKHVSMTDPAAAWSIKHGPGRFAYGLNAVVDTASGIILDVEAAPARLGDEPKASRIMVERLRKRHGLAPRVLTADKAYGSGPHLAWLRDRGIEAHIRVIEHLERHERRRQTAGQLPRSAFTYDAVFDSTICPQGARLAATKGDGSIVQYVSSVKDCRPCPIRAGCTSGLRRKVNRSRYEDVRQEVLAREATPTFQASLRLRRRIERLFACIKHNDGLHRLRLRGLRGAGEQFLLAATARNLKHMAMALTRAEPISG